MGDGLHVFLFIQRDLIKDVFTLTGDLRCQRGGTLERHLFEQQIEDAHSFAADRVLALRSGPAGDQHHAFAALLIAVALVIRSQFLQRLPLEGFEGLGQLPGQQGQALAAEHQLHVLQAFKNAMRGLIKD